MSILKRACDIVDNRSEEKTRQYGDFVESMTKTAKIASLLSNKEITTKDAYNILIALKFARESYSHKEDNLLDVLAYIGSLNDWHVKEFCDKELLNN